MFNWFWRGPYKHRWVSIDGEWGLSRDGAWRLTHFISGEVFTYDGGQEAYYEMMLDLMMYGRSYAHNARRGFNGWTWTDMSWAVAL